MKFPRPLVSGRLIARYKRFLADVELASGAHITASCPNTGSMRGLTEPGSTVWLSENEKPGRKYRHTWEMIETDLGQGPQLVGINTGHPNTIVREAISDGSLAEIQGYCALRREVNYGRNSRIDILLEDPIKGCCYVEVKNVHFMRRPGLAEFPDSGTARGVKHLKELGAMRQTGHRAVMVYLVQRHDATCFGIARDIDPAYDAAFKDAASMGVEMLAYRCRLSPSAITVERPIPINGISSY